MATKRHCGTGGSRSTVIRGAGVLLTLLRPVGVAWGQGVPLAPGTTLFQLDLSGTPVGEFPTSLTQIGGSMSVVIHQGVPMLKASALSQFLITLPQGQVLPRDFTVEVEFIPSCCTYEDLSLEGTATINQGNGSAHLRWNQQFVQVIGGGGDNYEAKMWEDPEAVCAGASAAGLSGRGRRPGRRHVSGGAADLRRERVGDHCGPGRAA
jgi:hypothetical protein